MVADIGRPREGAVVCVCGPCGSGKSTVAALLAKRLGAGLVEGDDFHPEANRVKMSAGAPLDDADRMPWLAALRAECSGRAERGEVVVLACSALKRRYREVLVGCPSKYEQGKSPWVFALLDVPQEVLQQRLGARQGHFMPPALLASQLAVLEKEDLHMLSVPAVEEGRQLSPQEITERLHAEVQHRLWRGCSLPGKAGDFALIAGSHVNQDGRSASLTAPSGPAQERCSRAVLKELAVKTPEIDTTECHGTGTALGDPIEIGAYRKVMSTDPRDEPVVITTSKSNIGHCEGSAGIGGFLKTLLMCMYGEGTPNCHFSQLNGHLDMEGFPGIITTEGVTFRGEASYNSVLSFGFGGTNACATVWGPNCMTSRALSCKDMYAVVSRRLRDAPSQTVAMPTDDWEDWEIDFPARDGRPDDVWDVEFDEEGGALFTRRDRRAEDFGSEYAVTGTFNGWGETAMEADDEVSGLQSAIITIGPSGFEEFQVLADSDPDMAFFPEVPHCTRKSAKVKGPSAADRESAWRIQGDEGDRYRVELHVSPAHAVSVSWAKER